MSTVKARRTRVEANIYKRSDGKFEIGYRDSSSIQRWQVIEGGIMAARAARDIVLADKAKGIRVAPDPKLTFGKAADKWLEEQVPSLRSETQKSYRNSIETHLRPKWGNRRLDDINVNDAAKLIRDLISADKSPWTIQTILNAAGRVFKYAKRHGWSGENPIAQLDKSERPNTSSNRNRIFTMEELEQVLTTAGEPWRTIFAVAAVTGARESEVLGLVWSDVELGEDSSIKFSHQIDRKGKRVDQKTDEARRTVGIPKSLVAILATHKLKQAPKDSDFVFATRSGKAISQRDTLRALHRTMDKVGMEKPRPTFHSLRHSMVSEMLNEGVSIEEISWQVGHKNSNITRAIYLHEIKSAKKMVAQRAAMESRYGSLMEATGGNGRAQMATEPAAEIVNLQAKRDARK